MKKRFKVSILGLCFIILLLTSCGKNAQVGDKVRDVEYTISQIEDTPELLVEHIITSKNEPFKLSLEDGNYIYIAIGYGEQDTHGYSISVLNVYETKDFLVVETELKGPGPKEKVIAEKDYPFIVIKAENIGLPICYK